MVTAKPKPMEPLSRWIEDNLRLPAGISAVSGPLKLHPYQREIADAMADPRIERVSVIKSARVGYTTLLVGLIAHHIVRDPAPILVLMPTESDCRGLMVDDIEGLFAESPTLRDHLPMPHPGRTGDRNTLVHRLFPGGSLKIVAAGSPRNMRRHSARVLNVDEVDACLATAEGDAVSLATQRTLTWPNRKIVCGGTPLDIETSTIARLYSESDQRIWTVPCPRCSEFHEIQWEAISWPEGHPEQAAWTCPSCGAVVEEKQKAAMIRRGRWHIQNPEATPRHVGFKINALSSSLPNAAWGKLAAEYERAKNDPALLKVFHNTALGIPWAEEGDHIDENALATRAEKFSLDAIPPEVLALSCGVDAQDDRLEPVICGWARDGTCFVLHHEPIWGDINDTLTWRQLEDLLRTRWPHPLGGFLKIDACCIDGGDGGHMEHVMAFCRPRTARRVLCVKGVAGFSRLPLIASKSKMRGGGRLWLAGVDSIKAQLFSRLQRGSSMRFSDTLAPEFYEQLGSERRVIRTVGGKPVVRFERIKGMRAEALDGLTYSVAARAALMLNEAVFNRREDELRSPPRPRAAPATEAPESPLAPEPSFLSTKHSLWQGKGGNPWLGPGRRSWWDRED